MKHTCPNNTQCTPSSNNTGVYSYMQMVIKVPNAISVIDCPKHLAPLSIQEWLWQADRRSFFIMSHTCSIGERSGDFAGQGSCTLQRAHCIAAALMLKKTRHLPVEEMAVKWGKQPVQCRAHCFLYSAETPNVFVSCNLWPPHTVKPEVGLVCCR